MNCYVLLRRSAEPTRAKVLARCHLPNIDITRLSRGVPPIALSGNAHQAVAQTVSGNGHNFDEEHIRSHEDVARSNLRDTATDNEGSACDAITRPADQKNGVAPNGASNTIPRAATGISAITVTVASASKSSLPILSRKRNIPQGESEAIQRIAIAQ